MKKRQKNMFIIFSLLVLVFVIILIILFQPKETRISPKDTSNSIDGVECESDSPTTSFFALDNAKDTLHTVKATFKDARLDGYNYVFKAALSNETDAKTAESKLHAKYNIAMGERGLNIDFFNPNFVSYNNELTINLYVNGQKISPSVSDFIFLSKEEAERLPKISIDDFAKLYESKNFICKIKK